MPNTVTLTERGVWIMATINGVEHYLCLVTEADAVEYALRERRLETYRAARERRRS